MTPATLPFEPDGNGGVVVETRAGASATAQGGGARLTAWSRVVRDTLWLSARAPLVAASIEQPAGSYADDGAVGNVEAEAHFRAAVWRSDSLIARVHTSVGVGAPTASNDALRLDARALSLGNALFGGNAPELFVPRILPARASVAGSLSAARWSLRASAAVANEGHATPIFEVGFASWLVGAAGVAGNVRVLLPSPIVALEAALFVRAGEHVRIAVEAAVSLGWSAASVGPSIWVTF